MSLKSGQHYMLSHTALYVLFTLFTGIYQAPRASLVAQMVKICLQCRRPGFYPWVRKISWRRAWLPNPVFLPGGFYGQRNLAGYSPWGHKESDTTEQLSTLVSSHIALLSVYGREHYDLTYRSHEMITIISLVISTISYRFKIKEKTTTTMK